MSKKKNILQEAIADAKSLKAGALKNAQNLLLENMKSELKEMVESEMNSLAEAEDCAPDSEEKEEVVAETADADLDDLGGDTDIMEDEGETDDLGLGLDDEESSDSEDTELGEEDLTEEDLTEALRLALQEVTHPTSGDVEKIDLTRHDTGLLDTDGKEDGWEKKKAPASKDWTVKEGALKNQIASLVKEVTLLRKANAGLKRTVNEVSLFNTKLLYATKILRSANLSEGQKKKIVSTLDESKTAEQVKLVYETLTMALGSLSESAKPKAKAPALSEALDIRAGNGKVAASSMLKETADGEDNRFNPNRLAMLAGIKTSTK